MVSKAFHFPPIQLHIHSLGSCKSWSFLPWTDYRWSEVKNWIFLQTSKFSIQLNVSTKYNYFQGTSFKIPHPTTVKINKFLLFSRSWLWLHPIWRQPFKWVLSGIQSHFSASTHPPTTYNDFRHSQVRC